MAYHHLAVAARDMLDGRGTRLPDEDHDHAGESEERRADCALADLFAQQHRSQV